MIKAQQRKNMQLQSKESKKPYHKPELSVYGDVKTFTLAQANGTRNDNSGNPAANKS